jgi:purine-binding chemotaxis protein CheW
MVDNSTINDINSSELRDNLQFENSLQMVGFKLGNEDYMVDINKIREIIMTTEITYVPRVPNYFEGVINLRGNIVPIINLRKKLNMPSKEITENTRILIMEILDMNVGFIVDKITKVIIIPEKNIDNTPTTFGGMAAEFIDGVGRFENKIIGWVNVEKIIENCMVE